MSETNSHAEDDAPPDSATGAPDDLTGPLGDALRPELSTEATRAIAKEMNSAISALGFDYAASIPRFDPTPTMSEITAAVQSSVAEMSAAMFDLGEQTRHVDLAKFCQIDMPKISELIDMPEFPKFPMPEEINEAARRFSASIQPYTAGGLGSHSAAMPLGIGLSEVTSGLKLDLPPLSPLMRDAVLPTGIGAPGLFGGHDPVRMLGLDMAKFMPADSPLLNLGREALGIQLAQFVPSGSIFEGMQRWIPGESIVESLRAWWPLASRGMPAAQAALLEALDLVVALERNEIGVRELVKQFLITWLRFRKVSPDLVTSAALVLLNTDCWLPAGLLHDFDPRVELRRLTLSEHRNVNRLSTDPKLQLCGRPLCSLDEPAPYEADKTGTMTRGDVVADPRGGDPAEQLLGEFTHPLMRDLWWKLTDRERVILRAKGQPGCTWAEAAIDCGGTHREGEALRRKVKRLSKRDLTSQHPDQAVS